MLFCRTFATVSPTRRFHTVWVSQWRGSEKSWMTPLMIKKVRPHRCLTLMVQIRKELPIFLTGSWPRLIMITTSHWRLQPATWKSLRFLSGRYYMKIFLKDDEKIPTIITGHEREESPLSKAFQPTQPSPPTKFALLFLRWEKFQPE